MTFGETITSSQDACVTDDVLVLGAVLWEGLHLVDSFVDVYV